MLVDFKVSEINSSNIKRVEFRNFSENGWSADSKGHMRITFQNNQAYIYEEVPFTEVLNLVGSESVGSYFNKNIARADYKFTKQL